MALSAKVAVLTSLGFIFGMSWLVNQVARPIVELPTPLVARGPGLPSEVMGELAGDVDARRGWRGVGGGTTGRLARASVLAVAGRPQIPDGAALVVAEPSPVTRQVSDVELPLQIPKAPTVALVVEREEAPAAGGPGGPVMAMTAVPEAIVASVPPSGARLLAALRPGPEADETVDTIADAEPATATVRQYQVKRGDSLVKIMRREWNRDDKESLSVLLAANPQVAARRDRIYVGELLNIPGPDSARAAPMVAQGDVAATSNQSSIHWYTIQKRDSLAGIARRHLNDPERWREIAKLNGLRNAHKILPGMRIRLPLLRTDT